MDVPHQYRHVSVVHQPPVSWFFPIDNDPPELLAALFEYVSKIVREDNKTNGLSNFAMTSVLDKRSYGILYKLVRRATAGRIVKWIIEQRSYWTQMWIRFSEASFLFLLHCWMWNPWRSPWHDCACSLRLSYTHTLHLTEKSSGWSVNFCTASSPVKDLFLLHLGSAHSAIRIALYFNACLAVLAMS